MLDKSNILDKEYDIDNVRYIPNMRQNFKYISSPLSHGQLVDIVCGENEKLVFVWKKSKEMKQLYDMWCNHEL